MQIIGDLLMCWLVVGGDCIGLEFVMLSDHLHRSSSTPYFSLFYFPLQIPTTVYTSFFISFQPLHFVSYNVAYPFSLRWSGLISGPFFVA